MNNSDIADFGKKIGGARKDTYFSRLALLPIPDGYDFKLSEVIPTLNPVKMEKEGLSKEQIAALLLTKNAIPTKSRRRLHGWKLAITAFRDLLEAIEIATPEKLAEVYSENRTYYFLLTLPTALMTRGATFRFFTSTKFEEGAAAYQATMATTKGRFLNHDTSSRIELVATSANWQETFAKTQAILESETKAPTRKRTNPFKVYQNRHSQEIYIGRKVRSTVIKIGEATFENTRAAFVHIAENANQLESTWQEMKKDPVLRRLKNEPRKGDSPRKGKDISSGYFHQTFPFLGVEFGNYVEQSRRQKDLNEAFDGLHDLALALGKDPSQIALNSRLGLAFGARGKGGKQCGAAHYEPCFHAINLTKRSGAGCLAHEWFHALDHHFGGFKFATEQGEHPIFSAIADAMKIGEFKARANELDKFRSKAYFNTTIELAARAFEKWIVFELSKKGISNDYLANLIGDSPAYPTNEEIEAMAPAFAALKTLAL